MESPGHHQAHVHGVVMSMYTRSSIVTCGRHRRCPEIPGVAAPREPVGRPLAKLHRAPRIPRSTSAIGTGWCYAQTRACYEHVPVAEIELRLFSCDYGYTCIRAVRSSCTMNSSELFGASCHKLTLELWCVSESFRWGTACPPHSTRAMARLPLPTAAH